FVTTIEVRSRGGARAAADGTASVFDPTLTVRGVPAHARAGVSFTGVVATFTDTHQPQPTGAYTALVTWDDGTASTRTVLRHASDSALSRISGTPTLVTSGPFSAAESGTKPDGHFGTSTSTIIVETAALAAAGVSFRTAEAVPFQTVAATFASASPAASAGQF